MKPQAKELIDDLSDIYNYCQSISDGSWNKQADIFNAFIQIYTAAYHTTYDLSLPIGEESKEVNK